MKKSLLKAPKRLQRVLLRMQKYDLQLVHCKGPQMELVELELESVNMDQNLPVSAACLEDLRVHTRNDADLQTLSRIIAAG